MYYFIRIFLIWLLCLLSVFLHESGHAAGYRISGGKAGWKVIAGSGPKMISTPQFIFRLIPVGGYFVPGEEPKTKKEKIAMLAGGPVVSLLLTVLFAIIRFCMMRFVQPESIPCEILLPVSSFLLAERDIKSNLFPIYRRPVSQLSDAFRNPSWCVNRAGETNPGCCLRARSQMGTEWRGDDYERVPLLRYSASFACASVCACSAAF